MHVTKTHMKICLNITPDSGHIQEDLCAPHSLLLRIYTLQIETKVFIEVSSFRFVQWSHQQTSAARFSILPGVDPKEPKAGLVCANQLLEKHCTTIKRRWR